MRYFSSRQNPLDGPAAAALTQAVRAKLTPTPLSNAFERFFARHSPALRRYLTRFVSRADAEELAQEAFARVYAGEGMNLESPRGYLFETARNLAITHLRRSKVAQSAIAEEVISAPATSSSSLEDLLERRQAIACVYAAIANLPERRREIFLMRMKEDLSYTEIAERAGISLKAVESHLARSVESCHDFFESCAQRGCSGKCKQGGGT